MPPVDVRASVISNVRLSRDYNVLTIAAPEVGALTEPGQFVMLKTTDASDPMLRRPFSVFEVLRDDLGTGPLPDLPPGQPRRLHPLAKVIR